MLTISAVAENKKIPLSNFSVKIDRISSTGNEPHTLFSVKIDIPSGLNERERIILFNAAKKCDVTKILNGKIDFSYQLIDG